MFDITMNIIRLGLSNVAVKELEGPTKDIES